MSLLGRKRNHAFTLVELAVVLLIIGIIVSGGLSLYGDRLNAARTQETEARLDRIEAALATYVQTFGALPCPAVVNVGVDQSGSTSPALPSGVNAFGVMTCDTSKYVAGAISGYGTGDMRADLGGRYMLVGMVPTRTLGIPDSYAVDGWNSRFMYAVDLYYAYNGSTPQWNTGTNPGLIVRGTDNSEKTNCGGNCAGKAGAVYVLWSFGPNIWGSWRDKANTSTVRTFYEISGTIKGDTGDGTGLEGTNARVNTNAGLAMNYTATFRDGTRRMTTSTSSYFDDFVRWKTRYQF